MRVDRLEILLDILREVRDAKRAFDLSYWVIHTREEQPKDEYCGTTACAIGYGALDRRLSDQGLKIVVDYRLRNYMRCSKMIAGTIQSFNKIAHNPDVVIDSTTVKFSKFKGLEAIHKFFKFHYSTAEYLFVRSSYYGHPNPTDIINEVIKRIQDVIATNEQCARDYFYL